MRRWVFDDWCAPQPIETGRMEVSYDNEIERGKSTRRDVANLDIFQRLRSPETVQQFRDLLDCPSLQDDPEMHGGGLHAMKAGGWLQVHVDYELHPRLPLERRLNLIAFLHHDWRAEWGGQLLLCDATGETVEAIDPTPGRLVAFETGPDSYHGVRELSPDAAIRLSAAVYFLASPRPTATRRRALFMPNRSKGGAPEEVRL